MRLVRRNEEIGCARGRKEKNEQSEEEREERERTAAWKPVSLGGREKKEEEMEEGEVTSVSCDAMKYTRLREEKRRGKEKKSEIK